mmetsp:Transcript_20559/g.51037  ORF Transcript_20559/g.51037 Transcript_20559/m.51037 type:complete len:571 (+) Transcript_20559:571-2283(+)
MSSDNARRALETVSGTCVVSCRGSAKVSAADIEAPAGDDTAEKSPNSSSSSSATATATAVTTSSDIAGVTAETTPTGTPITSTTAGRGTTDRRVDVGASEGAASVRCAATVTGVDGGGNWAPISEIAETTGTGDGAGVAGNKIKPPKKSPMPPPPGVAKCGNGVCGGDGVARAVSKSPNSSLSLSSSEFHFTDSRSPSSPYPAVALAETGDGVDSGVASQLDAEDMITAGAGDVAPAKSVVSAAPGVNIPVRSGDARGMLGTKGCRVSVLVTVLGAASKEEVVAEEAGLLVYSRGHAMCSQSESVMAVTATMVEAACTKWKSSPSNPSSVVGAAGCDAISAATGDLLKPPNSTVGVFNSVLVATDLGGASLNVPNSSSSSSSSSSLTAVAATGSKDSVSTTCWTGAAGAYGMPSSGLFSIGPNKSPKSSSLGAKGMATGGSAAATVTVHTFSGLPTPIYTSWTWLLVEEDCGTSTVVNSPKLSSSAARSEVVAPIDTRTSEPSSAARPLQADATTSTLASFTGDAEVTNRWSSTVVFPATLFSLLGGACTTTVALPEAESAGAVSIVPSQ